MSLQNFEADLITTFLRSKKRYIKLAKNLKQEHFKNDVPKWVFGVIRVYFDKHKRMPNLQVFRNELMKTSWNTGEKKLYYVGIKKLLKRKVKIPFSYIEENVSKKIDIENMLTAMDKAVTNIEKSDLSAAKKELLKGLLDSEKEDEVPIIRLLKDWKLRQEMRLELSKIPISQRFVSTPYPVFNKVVNGIQISEAATVAGLTGVGKSIMLGEFGTNSLLDGLDVVHFPLENTAEQTAQRYDSRLSTIRYDVIKLYEFKKKELKKFEKLFAVLASNLKSEVYIKEMFRDKTDIFEIDKTLFQLKQDGVRPGIVIVDSLDIMKSAHGFRDYRLDRASIYWDFKDYCKFKRITGLSSTQLKVTAKWQMATSEDLAEAYDKARILDMIFIMSQSEEDEKNNLVNFALDKNRDGIDKIKTILFKDSSKMRFLEVV